MIKTGHLPFFLLIIIAITIGTATIIEDRTDTQFVMQHVYSTLWFRLLWGATGISALWVILRYRLRIRIGILMLHSSLLIILCGALTTALTSRKGIIHLRQGHPERTFNIQEEGLAALPFELCLDTFRIEYYPGTDAPSDFVSHIIYNNAKGEKIREATISMNNIFTLDGYRLYQSSYDEDYRGSWLTVNYDPWGTTITYIGYAMLALSVIITLISGKENFRRLLKHPALKQGGLLIAAIMSVQQTNATEIQKVYQATDKPVAAIKAEQAYRLKRKQVVYNNRIVPLNTLAKDFVQKLTGKTSFRKLSAEQVMISWALYPEEWQKVKMIKVKNRELQKRLGFTDEYASFADFFDSKGNYRLTELYKEQQGTHNKLEKAIKEADEKIGIILMLTNGTLITPLPEDGSVKPLSSSKIEAELIYNSIPFSKILFIFNLTLGILLFFTTLYAMLHSNGRKEVPHINKVHTAGSILLYIATTTHTIGYCLRWYISGNIPLTNGFETMQFVALCTLLIACILHRRFPFTLPFGFILSGFTPLVSHLGEMNPQITPLMPVLVSPWLSSHVSLIMVSYSLFAFIMLNGITALCLIHKKILPDTEQAERKNRQIETLTILSRLMLYPATFMLAIGIFLGAVWANVSWGSYWSWDPKEVWALMTMIVYGLAFHRSSLKAFRNPSFFHTYMVLAFLTVLMTYFGVNYLLGGMHSYAG